MPPAFPATAAACFSTACSSRASTRAVSAVPPAATISRATASSFASVRPAWKTLAPSRAKRASDRAANVSSSAVDDGVLVLAQYVGPPVLSIFGSVEDSCLHQIVGEATQGLLQSLDGPEFLDHSLSNFIKSPQARRGTIEQHLALARVSRERSRALELRACFVEAAEFFEKVAARARQEVIGLERRLRHQRIGELETRCWTERDRDRDRTIQLHDGRWLELGECIVECRDACPVRLLRRTRSRVTCGNRSLQGVRAKHSAKLFGTLECCEATMDEELIPKRAILVEEQDRLSRRADSRVEPRRLDLHQCDEAMDLRLNRKELGQDTAKTERILAELRSYPVVTGGRRVAFVEDEIDDAEDPGQTDGELVSARHLERHPRLGEGPLGADNSLGDRRLRDEECTRDLLRRQTPEQPERERNARLARENRMAGY